MKNLTPRTDSVYTLAQDRAGAQFEMARTLELELATARSTMVLARAVITALEASEADTGEAFPTDEDGREINASQCFGGFEFWGATNVDGAGPERPVVVEWPDLRLVLDALNRALKGDA